LTTERGFANLGSASMPRDVFLSYASQDRAVAEQVCAGLEGSGITCWMAPRDIAPGAVYARAIMAAIKGCRAMVVVFSAHANASDHVLNEVSSGLSRRIPIVPFRIDECVPSEDLEYYLAARQWLDASRGALEFHLQQLAEHLTRALAVAPPGASMPAPSSPARGRRMLLGLAGAAVGVLALMTWNRIPGPAPVRSAGSVAVNSADGQAYVWVPPGRFEMGCSPGDGECANDESPRHTVVIREGFWMGQTEVTRGAYRRFAGFLKMPPAPAFPQEDDHPVVNVTWDDARAYCQWAGGRLPTEAEWEYAARAGSEPVRYGPLEEAAWYADNAGRARLDSGSLFATDEKNYWKKLTENGNGTHAVRGKKPNSWNLYDVLGNVWEWCSDWYDKDYYQSSPERDPLGPARGEFRLLRGGAWVSTPRDMRVSLRYHWLPPVGRDDGVGFRCVLPIPEIGGRL
jgi:formylglycine-generating enzyme required for sulfatase activity